MKPRAVYDFAAVAEKYNALRGPMFPALCSSLHSASDLDAASQPSRTEGACHERWNSLLRQEATGGTSYSKWQRYVHRIHRLIAESTGQNSLFGACVHKIIVI
jgi:hypothetical protein